MAQEQEQQQVEQKDPIVESAVEQEVSFQEETVEEGVEASESVDWEAEAKKFQSMYDKKSADYDKLNNEVEELRKYQQLGKVLQDRPDVVEAMRNTLSGNTASKQEEPKVAEDSFDPWEAYYKPGSPSYEMRVQQEKAVAQQAVQKTKTIPTTAGVVQGSAPEQPNELDDVWKGVMSISNRKQI